MICIEKNLPLLQGQSIPILHGGLEGELRAPADADSLVICAHGSACSRKSPQNPPLAQALREAGIATLFFDLAGERLPDVQSPTLLIVGGLDDFVLELNKQAYQNLRCEKELQVVAGATHQFEETGTFETVARLTTDWFQRHLKEESGESGESGASAFRHAHNDRS